MKTTQGERKARKVAIEQLLMMALGADEGDKLGALALVKLTVGQLAPNADERADQGEEGTPRVRHRPLGRAEVEELPRGAQARRRVSD